eukprot:TRINITY_DN3898_c0_g1_i1.p1 TRINITY_DN3898_c0_g1~~TRINITY_DN3898_c0_g1_i1.p1  ORF type:complete len:101 (-),score=23.63 TRINITY_DN3898_c0_g1_i1:278-538(-)
MVEECGLNIGFIGRVTGRVRLDPVKVARRGKLVEKPAESTKNEVEQLRKELEKQTLDGIAKGIMVLVNEAQIMNPTTNGPPLLAIF